MEKGSNLDTAISNSIPQLAPLVPDGFLFPMSDHADEPEIAPFLRVLRTMLDDESDEILRWTRDGTAFEILDIDALTIEILPKYFKHNKYPSFQRQLNYFHFKKWTKSRANICTFSNEWFHRDRPEMSAQITRKKSSAGRKESFEEWLPGSLDPLEWTEEALEEGLLEEDLELLATLEEIKHGQ
ncbi:unnamed protein product [Aphanomyces euteiches]